MCSKIFPINHQTLYSPPSIKVNFRYHSFLLSSLQTGSNFTIQTFVAHRHSFIGESDLSAISSLGLQMVRLPITWAAFADALAPLDQKIYASHDPKKDTVIAAGVIWRKVVFVPKRCWRWFYFLDFEGGMIIFFLNMFDILYVILWVYYKYTVHIVRTIFTDSFTIFVILSFSIGGTRSFLHRSRCICDHSKRLARGIFGSLFKTWHPGSFRFTCLSRRFFLRHLQWCFFHLQNLFFYIVFFFATVLLDVLFSIPADVFLFPVTLGSFPMLRFGLKSQPFGRTRHWLVILNFHRLVYGLLVLQ